MNVAASPVISAAVMALNEQPNIRETIANLLQAADKARVPIEIIIVNDGSTDDTGKISDELSRLHSNIRVLHHPVNMGLGVNVKDALAVASAPKFIIVPGDNDMSVALLEQLFSYHDKADIIMSYFLNREVRGRVRNIISAVFNLIYMSTFNVFVQYINGPCVYPTERLKKLRLHANRFSIVVEMTIKMLCSGCTYHEVYGYMATGLRGSSSLSWRNFREVMSMYLRLCWEVKVSHRDEFGKSPRRLFL